MKYFYSTILFFGFLTFFLFNIHLANAQSTADIYNDQYTKPVNNKLTLTKGKYACPNYEFTKTLVKGGTNEEVRVIQQILNLDRRTIVSYSGLGSSGNESAYFGVGTRSSLKRFQALFIEYIGVADGKFNEKTMAVMNNVCKGPFFTGSGKNVYDLGTTTATTTILKIKDTLPPIIGIAAISTTTVDTPFRAYIAASKAIKTPPLSGLIIAGATAGDMRKTSSTTFTFLVTPNADVKGKITLQMEADAVQDLAGNKNAVASNEWTTYIILDQSKQTGDPTTDSLASGTFPAIDFPAITPATDCSAVASVSIYDYSNPCYGKAPTTQNPADSSQSGGGGGGGGGMEQIMQMLQGMMKGLGGGGGGGGGKDGGSSGGQMACACTGNPTIQLNGKMGVISGRYDMSMNPGGGDWVDNGILPPPPICGFLKFPDQKTCIKSKKCPGDVCDPTGCCHPEMDMTLQIVKGMVPSKPIHEWVGGG